MRIIQAGVTLIELLVSVTVLGILAGAALPSYRQAMIRAQRSEAKTELSRLTGTLERCIAQFNAYDAPVCVARVHLPYNLPSATYRISATSLDSTSYQLLAEPLGSQADDHECGALSLNSSLIKGVTGSAPATQCWNR